VDRERNPLKLSRAFFILINMIYKFTNYPECSTSLEVEKRADRCLLTVYVDDEKLHVEISQGTLYDFIGALHQIQNKIKKEVEND